MAENGSDDEKTILGKSVRNKIKYGTAPSGYGSTSAPSDSTELYIKHPVLDGETLVSIALKYGLKTSYLQRVNHLWNDCIFWRQFLYIPVSTSDSIPTNYKGEIFTKTDIKKSLSKSTSHGQLSEDKDSPRDKEKSCSVQETNSLSTAKDYFSKFDSSLAKIKDNVDRLEKQSRKNEKSIGSIQFVHLHDTLNPLDQHGFSSSLEQTSNPLNHLPRKKPGSLRRSWNAGVEALDPTKEPEMRFLSQSNNSPVNKAHDHLEKAQDELFQL